MLHQMAHKSRLAQIAPSDCRIHVALKVSKVDSASAPGLRARRARATGFRRDSHHVRLLRAGGDNNDTLVPPRRRARACARPPLRMLHA